jgi:hypothetical protein
VNLEGHQVFEAFKALFYVCDGLGDAAGRHETAFILRRDSVAAGIRRDAALRNFFDLTQSI